MSNDNTTSHVLNTSQSEMEPAATATKACKVPKKRGRKGDKIVKAFAEIPVNPVNFVDYAEAHQVSPNVLRQIKRHDKFSDTGKVFVRKNKQTKVMMIWREPTKLA